MGVTGRELERLVSLVGPVQMQGDGVAARHWHIVDAADGGVGEAEHRHTVVTPSGAVVDRGQQSRRGTGSRDHRSALVLGSVLRGHAVSGGRTWALGPQHVLSLSLETSHQRGDPVSTATVISEPP